MACGHYNIIMISGNNYICTRLGERVYIMFDLDPSLEIQPNFMFAVSELRLCQHTVAAVSPTTTEPCSNQHWIVTVRGEIFTQDLVILSHYKIHDI